MIITIIILIVLMIILTMMATGMITMITIVIDAHNRDSHNCNDKNNDKDNHGETTKKPKENEEPYHAWKEEEEEEARTGNADQFGKSKESSGKFRHFQENSMKFSKIQQHSAKFRKIQENQEHSGNFANGGSFCLLLKFRIIQAKPGVVLAIGTCMVGPEWRTYVLDEDTQLFGRSHRSRLQKIFSLNLDSRPGLDQGIDPVLMAKFPSCLRRIV